MQVKDKLWIWGHEAGSHTGSDSKGRGLEDFFSRMTPAEGAFYLGVPNIVMVRYANKPTPPFDQYAMALQPLKRVVWSIVGAEGISENKEVNLVRNLAMKFPNICGVIMDDFFVDQRADGEIAVFTPSQLDIIKEQLIIPNRKLDLWIVLYDYQLSLPVNEHLERSDLVTFWTWRSEELKYLERNFEQVEKIAPFCRKVLGCYMYDYGEEKQMPVSLMKRQCQIGLKWLQEGRIEGMIFLASCICDLDLKAIEWTRQWIQEVGGNSLNE